MKLIALTPWLSLSSGIGFKKYEETNHYSAKITTTSDTINTFIDNSYYKYDSTLTFIQNDSVWLIDSTWIVDTATVTTINHETVTDSSKKAANGKTISQYVQIPISTQLIFVNSDKLTAYVNLGISIGILTKNSGVTIGYSSDNILPYKTKKTIFNSLVGVGFNYKFHPHFSYKVYGAYQLNLSNISLQPNIEKRYQGFNFRTGLVLHF